MLQQALRFVLVGGLCTALHYGVYVALLYLVPLFPAQASYALGFTAGFGCNVWFTGKFTFSARITWPRVLAMMGIQGINALLHVGTLSLSLALGLSPHLAPLPAFAIAIPLCFILARYTFRSSRFESL